MLLFSSLFVYCSTFHIILYLSTGCELTVAQGHMVFTRSLGGMATLDDLRDEIRKIKVKIYAGLLNSLEI